MPFRSSAERPVVLVVDDDPDVRGILGMLLERDGYEVVTAIDGAAALEHVKDERIALVVLDLQMPRLDGDQFRRVYQERGGHAPILLVTAAEVSKNDLERLGVSAFIAKPFDVDTVMETVHRLVAEGR
jgi:chemosensory pili system protein ChpA (sensor histidine kinase/response regulator)